LDSLPTRVRADTCDVGQLATCMHHGKACEPRDRRRAPTVARLSRLSRGNPASPDVTVRLVQYLMTVYKYCTHYFLLMCSHACTLWLWYW